jgi:hypothetical protein
MIGLFSPITTNGYMPNQTHPLVNKNAVELSSVGDFLKNRLDFTTGIDEVVDGKSVSKWMQIGGTDEDNFPRGVDHFHDPTKAWGNAGILGQGFSSLQWAQDHTIGPAPTCEGLSALGIGIPCPEPPPSANPTWSWPAARNYFYQAVTSADPTERDAQFGKTFYTLGRVMHLLADAAVPEHTRNDQHMMFPFGSRYEEWAEDTGVPSGLLSLFIQDNYMLYPVDYSVITSQSNVPGYIPISNFWDTTPDPGYGVTLLGLAEYTNHNFLSAGTIFKNYTYPVNPQLTSGYIQVVHDIDEKADEKVYFSGTTSDGRAIDHLVSTGYLWADLERVSPLSMDPAKFVLDENCFYDYANILVPKAVDYDAGLLNYFFRGTLEISAPNRCIYGLIDGAGTQEFTKIKAKIRNTSSIKDQSGNSNGFEEIKSGSLVAIVKYKKRTNYLPDLANDPPTADSIEPNFSYSVSETLPLTPELISALNGTVPQEFTLDFTGSPIPAGITDLYLQVVFKGTLGNEADNAIAVGFKDLSEPTHINLWNTTNFTYTAGHWDASTQTFVPGPLHPSSDASQSSDPERVTINEKIAFCPSNIPVQNENEYQVEYAAMNPGEFGRLIFISNSNIPIKYAVTDTPIDHPYAVVVNVSYTPWAAVNQDGATNDVYEFRGKAFHEAAGYVYRSFYDAGFWFANWPNATQDAIAANPLNW